MAVLENLIKAGLLYVIGICIGVALHVAIEWFFKGED